MSKLLKNKTGFFIAGILVVSVGLFGDYLIANSDAGIGPTQRKVIFLGVITILLGVLISNPSFLKPRKIMHGFLKLETRFFLGLFLLVLVNFLFRKYLEQADLYIYNYYELYLPDIFAQLGDYQWWRPFIPGFSGLYSPINQIIMLYLPTKLGPANTWYLFHAVLIIATFFLSWSIFHSRVFSYSLCICLGFGSQLYHTYNYPGSLPLLLLFVLYEIILVSIYHLFQAESPEAKRKWGLLVGLFLVIMALYNTSWLDFLVFMWVAGIFLFVFFKNQGKNNQIRVLTSVLTAATIIGLLYVIVVVKLIPHNPITSGREEDVVFNYPYIIPAVEDIISNYFTYFYMGVSNFLPPFMVNSNSLYLFGPEKLIEMQNGYHVALSDLITMQHLFMWRYYAGVWLVIFANALYKSMQKTLQKGSYDHLVLSVFMIMVMLGSPTHIFIKARPYMSVPSTNYKVTVAILGMSLLISYLLMIARRKMSNKHMSTLMIVAGWTILFYGALSRPVFLGNLNSYVDLARAPGGGPDPLTRLLMMISQFFGG
jgi:hypothetical protein